MPDRDSPMFDGAPYAMLPAPPDPADPPELEPSDDTVPKELKYRRIIQKRINEAGEKVIGLTRTILGTTDEELLLDTRVERQLWEEFHQRLRGLRQVFMNLFTDGTKGDPPA